MHPRKKKVDNLIKNSYKFFESNWGVTVAVTAHKYFTTLTTLELTEEMSLKATRTYIKCRDGVVIDDHGEVTDLELGSECPAYLAVSGEVDLPVMLASASARKHKVGGLVFGEKTALTLRTPSQVDWLFREV